LRGGTTENLFDVPPKTEHAAWFAGYDCGEKGANKENCHFSFFTTPNLTKAWERGKKAATRDIVWYIKDI